MSAHAFWATSVCQSLSCVGLMVSHHMSTPAKSTAKQPSFRQNGLTKKSTITNAIASTAAAILLPAPSGPSNQMAPNAHAAAMMPTTAKGKPPAQRPRRFILAQRAGCDAGDQLDVGVFKFLLSEWRRVAADRNREACIFFAEIRRFKKSDKICGVIRPGSVIPLDRHDGAAVLLDGNGNAADLLKASQRFLGVKFRQHPRGSEVEESVSLIGGFRPGEINKGRAISHSMERFEVQDNSGLHTRRKRRVIGESVRRGSIATHGQQYFQIAQS